MATTTHAPPPPPPLLNFPPGYFNTTPASQPPHQPSAIHSNLERFLGLFVTYIPVAIVALLMAWSLYASLVHVGPLMATAARAAAAGSIVMVWGMVGWAYYKVVVTSPGCTAPNLLPPSPASPRPRLSPVLEGIPLSHISSGSSFHDVPLQAMEEAQYNHTPSSSAFHPRTDDHIPLPAISTKQNGAARFCRKCNVPKPDRAHHCSTCKRCILKMDHHCPWVATCVGFGNYKFFLLFVMYLSIYCTLQFAFTVQYFLFFISDLDSVPYEQLYTAAHIIGLTVAAFMFGLLMFGFWVFHLTLVFENQTTIESMENQRFASNIKPKDSNPWDLGWRQNWVQVFGPRPWIWFLPIESHVGDGFSFPISLHAINHNEMGPLTQHV